MALLLELAQFDVLGADPSPVEGSLWCKSTGLSVYTGGVTRPLEMTTNKNVANGYPGLDVNSRLAQAQLPAQSLLQTVSAQTTVNITRTGSTAFATLLSAPITTSGPNRLNIRALGAVSIGTANRQLKLRITVDGVSQGGVQSRSVAANIAFAFAIERTLVVAAGARAVLLEWAVEVASSVAQCRPTTNIDGESASLVVQEVKV